MYIPEPKVQINQSLSPKKERFLASLSPASNNNEPTTSLIKKPFRQVLIDTLNQLKIERKLRTKTRIENRNKIEERDRSKTATLVRAKTPNFYSSPIKRHAFLKKKTSDFSGWEKVHSDEDPDINQIYK